MGVGSEQPFLSTAEPGSLRAAGRLPGTSRGSPTICRGAAAPGGDGGPTLRTAAPGPSSCPARTPAGACRPRGQTEGHWQPPAPLSTWKACGPAAGRAHGPRLQGSTCPALLGSVRIRWRNLQAARMESGRGAVRKQTLLRTSQGLPSNTVRSTSSSFYRRGNRGSERLSPTEAAQ